jgi:folate-dependent phosphoribosylglycinamide formyltransferase PurN
MTLDIGWFSTGRGPGSRKLLAAVHDEIACGRLDARVAVVFCNRERGEDENTDHFVKQVESYGLPLVTLSSRAFRKRLGERPARKGQTLPEWRKEYDREVMRLLEPFEFQIGILAGYMLIFGEEFTRKHDLLNLHPALPGGPVGIWQDIIWQLIESRAEQAGVMIHLATPDLDEGPPVTFCSYSIRGSDLDAAWRAIEGRSVDDIKSHEGEDHPLFAEIRRKGVAREVPLVIETLRAFAERRVRVRDKRVVDQAGKPVPPFDLTSRIEHSVTQTPA